MAETQLLQIIRHFLNNEPMTDVPDWPRVWALAKKHGLAQFVYLYMSGLAADMQPDDELQKSISKYYASMVVCHVNQDAAIRDIHSVLEENECRHLFFKGSVTRGRYPDPHWRSMADIDFLYSESQHERVKATLLENGFSGYKEGRKNDTYYRKPYVSAEAHRQLVPSDSSFYPYCSHVWERAHLAAGSAFLYEMSPEDELIFSIVHLAIHFLEGGAGIRFVLDIYVYNRLKMDFEYIEQELLKLDLLDFYRNVSALAENWFGHGEKTELSEKLADFILSSGTFGNAANSSALAVREGRLKYVGRMCFPSYREMVSVYPWLTGKILLLPIAWVIRGFRVLRTKKGSVRKLAKRARRGDKTLGQDLSVFYRECGLRSSL